MPNLIKFPNVVRQEYVDILRSWGVQAPDPIPGLDASQGGFVNVEAPIGWKVDYHPHSMYRVLVDDRGLWRATYFAKMSSWDPSIEFQSVERAIHTSCSYTSIQMENPEDEGRTANLWIPKVVLGHCWVLWEGSPNFLKEAREMAAAVMIERYPLAKDVNAYWDFPIPVGAQPHKVQA